MEPFRREAHFGLMRDTGFIALAAATMMLAFSYRLELAFCIGASVALLFAVVLVFKVGGLTEEAVQRSEPWLALERGRRPRGHEGRRWARDRLEDLLLLFAKRSSGIAVAMFGVALVVRVI
jgi:Ca2+/Na+ antiporter